MRHRAFPDAFDAGLRAAMIRGENASFPEPGDPAVEGVLLDDIPFEVDLDAVLRRLCVGDSGEDAAVVRRLVGEAKALARPKAFYREAHVDSRGDDFLVADGVRLTSRVLRVNVGPASCLFPFVASCGRELEEWSSSIEDSLHRYWADTIKEIALGSAAAALKRHITENRLPGKAATLSPGAIDDWPLGEQRALFELLGERASRAVGVELTESCLMVPIKSISGIRFATETGFESCRLCRSEVCPGRRAPYDADLYRRRYAVDPAGRGT